MLSAGAWPSWAEKATGYGEPSSYFDAEEQVRALSVDQRRVLPGLIKLAESHMAGPNSIDANQLTDWVLEIGMRVAPSAGRAAIAGWVSGLITSLEKTPADLLVMAVSAARYQQFQYQNEVGIFIADHIAEPMRSRRIKLNRLREMALKAHALPAPLAIQCTPEQAAEIMAEFGFRSAYAAARPERTFHKPTRKAVEAPAPAEKIDGMSPAIEARRARLREGKSVAQ